MFGYKLEGRRDSIGSVPSGRKVEPAETGMFIPHTYRGQPPFIKGGEVVDSQALGTIETRVLSGAAGLAVLSAAEHTRVESESRLLRRQRQIPPGVSAATRRRIELDNRLRRLGIRV